MYKCNDCGSRFAEYTVKRSVVKIKNTEMEKVRWVCPVCHGYDWDEEEEEEDA